MNLAHVHLALTHVPVIGVVVGLALLAYAVAKDKADVRNASLLLFAVVGAVALVAYFTGESAEDAVERVAGVSRSTIHAHEEAALFALLSSGALGLLSLGGLVVFRAPKSIPRWFTTGALVVALVASGTLVWTAGLGGLVRHPEAQGWTSTPDLGGATAGQGQERRGREGRESRESR